MIQPGFAARRDPRLRARYFSLNELDRKIERYIDFDHGVFIEAGANDGISQSNTLHFERYRGWRGLLIEPVENLARRCRAARPRSLTLNFSLGSFEQRGTMVDMTFCDLMSVVDGALKTPEEQREHLRIGAEIQGLSTYRLTVQCFPLSDVICKYGLGRIDLLSLDVEGFEENVLRGIDFTRHRPRFMLIEARYRKAIEDIISPYYVMVEELTDKDVLYKSRSDLAVQYAAHWRYTAARKLQNALALVSFRATR